MAMYCRAMYAAERKMYDIAVDAFTKLGDFKDSAKMAAYYKAMGYEEVSTFVALLNANATDEALKKAKQDLVYAKRIYSEYALFKDCAARIAICDEQIDCINQELAAEGYGHSKKNAEQDAARKACISLKLV